MKIEVYWSDGRMTGFPFVKEDTIRGTNGFTTFKFGKSGTHEAMVNMHEVKFIETMPDEED